MSFRIVEVTLAAAVADNGTVTLAYPAGTNQAFFTGANASADGVVVLNDNDLILEDDPGVSFTYGAGDITLTNLTGQTWAAGTRIRAQLGRIGNDRPGFQPSPAIADLATAANVATAVVAINQILAVLRVEGIIES